MHKLRKIAFPALLLVGFAISLQALAQTPVQLSPRRQIRKGVDAWPLILNPKSDAERRINKHLGDLNTRLLHNLKECHANYVKTVPREYRATKKGEEGAEFWTQDTKVTMRGPALLSLVSTTTFYCGGAHPTEYTDAAVFDLTTGEPADLRAWFLPSVKLSVDEEGQHDTPLERSVSPLGLLQVYRDATHHECDQTYPDDQQFLIWPDAKSGKVMIQADRMPGCCEACGIEIGLTLEQARKLNFSETFLEAISDAHQRLAPRR